MFSYKLLCVCFSAINGSGSAYLSEPLHVYTPSHALCSSSDTRRLKIQKCNHTVSWWCAVPCTNKFNLDFFFGNLLLGMWLLWGFFCVEAPCDASVGVLLFPLWPSVRLFFPAAAKQLSINTEILRWSGKLYACLPRSSFTFFNGTPQRKWAECGGSMYNRFLFVLPFCILRIYFDVLSRQ